MSSMVISVVIPCYNVARHIETVVEQLPSNVRHIILVNDCSRDNTEEKLTELSKVNKKVIHLTHAQNQGVGGAMITGFRKSMQLESDITIKLDGDNQMDTAYISQLLQPLCDLTADYAKGNRFRDFTALKQMPVARRVGNLGLSFCIKAASGYWNVFDPSNGYVAITNKALKEINLDKIHKRFFFESSMLIELYYIDAVVKEVPMRARYGDEVSSLSISKTLVEFPPKLLLAFIKRVVLKYFLFDFNIASIYILFGLPLFFTGVVYGGLKWIEYSSNNIPAPTGTVVIPTLLITLGFQLLLSASYFDLNNYPKR